MSSHEKCLEQHITPLLAELAQRGYQMWSEHGEDGWINISCAACHCTHEVSMREDDEEPGNDSGADRCLLPPEGT